MRTPYFLLRAGAACGALLLPGLAPAQAPTVTAVEPGRNATNVAPTAAVALTFSASVTGAGTVRVFGSQRGGRRPGTASGDGTAQLVFQPARPFGLGEVVSVTVPAAVRGTGAGAPATAGTVYQFRTSAGTGRFTADFSGSGSLPEPTPLYDPTLADVNNDGRLDLLLADPISERVRLRLGDAAAGLGPAIALSTGETPTSLAVADVNNDGNLDLLTSCNGATARRVAVALGNGQGAFAAPLNVAVAAPPGPVRVGDVNADGNLDFVVTVLTPTSAALAVRLGNGQGGFAAAPDVPLDPGAVAGTLADFNNDGRLDFLAGSPLKTYLGNGQGGFAPAPTVPLPNTGPAEVAEMTGDGILDVLIPDNAANTIRLYPGTGQGSFNSPVYIGISRPTAVHTADLNNDGLLDVLATYNNGPSNAGMARWLNLGNRPLSAPTLLPNCVGTDFATGDINNDGSLDLVVYDSGVPTGTAASPNLKIRLNRVVVSATRPAANALAATCYPNPAHGTVQVLLPAGAAHGLQAELYNTLGQRLRQQQLPAVPAGAAAALGIDGLPAGLYTLRLSDGAQTSSQQLVIE